MKILKLSPEHSGTFEIFRAGLGKRYARYSDAIGYTWYVYDFFTESYQSLSNETKIGSEDLIQDLENAYQKDTTPMPAPVPVPAPTPMPPLMPDIVLPFSPSRKKPTYSESDG